MAIIKKNLDLTADPGKDFYQFANGGWMTNNPLPEEYSRYGSFDKLAEDNQKMVRKLIEEAAASNPVKGSIEAKVGDFYNVGMDIVKIETEGIKPLNELSKIIDNISQSDQIFNAISQLHKKSIPVVFFLYGAPDKLDSNTMIANLYQGGLGLTDVDYYTSKDEKSEEIRIEYRKYISSMLKLTGINSETSSKHANIIFEMEERLASESMTRLERRDPHRTYNKFQIDELVSRTPYIQWPEYFHSIGLNISDINVAQPNFFHELNDMIRNTPIENWKTYLKWHLLNHAASYLSSAFVQENFNFYGKFLSGKKVVQPRWKRVIQVADFALGEAIGQMFVKKHFPPEAKQRMLELVDNLRKALEERINGLDWMGNKTKEEARNKLSKMTVKIGYPDKWRDYSNLEVKKDSYFNNVVRASEFNHAYRMSKIGKPVDPDDWSMTPQTVNAYYNPSRNEIVFPAGILQPPFFFLNADDAVNYGAIGMVIGHEMTHGFDDQGRKYNKDGNLKDWWTEEDAEKFEKRSSVLVDQFNAFRVLDNVKVNGELTLGENIADLGGLNIAFTALKKAWEKNTPKAKINGFTPEQRFFLAYAHVWAQNITEQEILRRIKEDVHSLGKLRVNGPLPNMPEFYEAFGIGEDSPMYIEEWKRAVIW